MTKIENRNTAQDVQFRELDGGRVEVWGYAAVFYRADVPGTEYRLSDRLVERIDPKAFGRALGERDDVRALFNHDPDNLLARVGSETLELSTDERGLRYAFDFDPTDPDHQRVFKKIERGDLTGSSFSFVVDSQRFDHQEEGPDVRTILSVELFDVGPVTFPAYEATTAGTRDADGLGEALTAWEAWKASGLQGGRMEALKRLREIELDRRRLTGSGPIA